MNFIYKLQHIMCLFLFVWLSDSHINFSIEIANS